MAIPLTFNIVQKNSWLCSYRDGIHIDHRTEAWKQFVFSTLMASVCWSCLPDRRRVLGVEGISKENFLQRRSDRVGPMQAIYYATFGYQYSSGILGKDSAGECSQETGWSLGKDSDIINQRDVAQVYKFLTGHDWAKNSNTWFRMAHAHAASEKLATGSLDVVIARFPAARARTVSPSPGVERRF